MKPFTMNSLLAFAGVALLGYLCLAFWAGAQLPDLQGAPLGVILFNQFSLSLPLVWLFWLARQRSR